MSVCVSVISDISGTAGHSATLHTPSCTASPGKLRRLLELTERLVGKEKPLKPFRWLRVKPCPSRYNGATLKKLVVFLKRVNLFCLQLRCSKEEQPPHCLGSFAKA